MSSAPGTGRHWKVAAIAWALSAAYAGLAAAQPPGWSVPSYRVNPAISNPYGLSAGPAAGSRFGVFGNQLPPIAEKSTLQPAPLARVVKNPDEASGLPPYALTDHAGAIQRYVEPVPGIDLEPYVGTVVRVRHDTGRTLLASQLDLPPQPVAPLESASEPSGTSPPLLDISPSIKPVRIVAQPEKRTPVIRAAEFVDEDDGTVQLLADTEEILPAPGDSAKPSATSGKSVLAAPIGAGGSMPGEGIVVEQAPIDEIHSESMSSSRMVTGGGPLLGEPIEMGAGPMHMGGLMPDIGMEYTEGIAGQWGVCPECGGHHMPPGLEELGYDKVDGDGWRPACRCHREKAHFYAGVQLNFLRAHAMENFAGKLSEKYDFSPRVILGFEGVGSVNGRARYWHYGRGTQVLGDGSIRIDFDVVDLEAAHTIAIKKSAFMVSAGFRTADIDLDDVQGDQAGCNLLGMTVAGDFHTLLCQVKHGKIVGVCGARLSILGGDWGRNPDSDIIAFAPQDDNVVVDELYAGIGFETCCRKLDLHARLGFEMQNWHSDVLSQFAGADSIGFIGPGLEIGAKF